MNPNATTAGSVLAGAARIAGFGAAGAELIRDGSNVMYRLPSGVVARIGRPGTGDTARREVLVSRWLDEAGLPAVRALADAPQPVMIGDRPVTWWVALPAHRPATPAELGAVLGRFHSLPAPRIPGLPRHDPFIDLDRRIGLATALDPGDRTWLERHLGELERRYQDFADAGPTGVIHGDAWQGNVAVPETGRPILLDLEMVSFGRYDWDLVQVAVDHTDFARITTSEYESFVAGYGGYDVTRTPGYRTLADIQELRWVAFALSKVGTRPEAAAQARHRIACLRGDVSRPWSWSAL
ncbi:Ser/Thr protein kinase RdoA involved in Cpx stress response, MazF antagonist [Amycolatopsis tolypomycina]|uniref:Ser/Thr protein kinase RdoA involved in Cpx stress response, MazF antagonist n=1 Tax=Amycolatopsis tolypomycina TaxID=208445 RepID=A0A1H4PSH1_9PSEU|nr:aminoglycoside phosphotransferase family protein [Amycolatopsis tolypomycina]SEC10306.1 Ser/Thr protein kinase RdoA involved in Cpx stress response, MazF antagonist [Amycolatopsis tolypomycina]